MSSIFAAGTDATNDNAALVTKSGTVVDSTQLSSDSTTAVLQSSIADSLKAAAVAAKQDSMLSPVPSKKADGAPAAPAERTSARKIKLIKREYNYRQQVGLAVGMMAFIAIMMTTAQSWNPK